MTLGRCENERQDKNNNNNYIYLYIYRLTAENLIERAKGIYKKVSNVQNLIFKRTLIKFK
jgi:hypothetical protein